VTRSAESIAAGHVLPEPAPIDPIERESLECVTGLTGGEMETDPWYFLVTRDDRGRQPTRDAHFPKREGSDAGAATWRDGWMLSCARYWYDGTPEHSKRKLDARYDWPTLRTIVTSGDYSAPHRELVDREGRWTLAAYYVGSGEADCYRDSAETGASEPDCPLCEGSGYVYVGQVIEAVYRLREGAQS
jgi:hypothetical protein